MKKLLLLLFICRLLPAYTQEAPAAYALAETYNLWNISKGQDAFVFSDVAYIRDYPSLEGKLLDSIIQGQKITITSSGYNGNTIKGFRTPWHQVSYQKGNVIKTGFIWLGLLALGRQVDEDGIQYLYGFDRYTPSTGEQPAYYTCGVKIFTSTGKLISKYNYRFEHGDQTFTESKLLPNMGLDGLRKILRIAFIGEACGIPSEYYYMGWDGNHGINMPRKYTVSDAGIYYYEESLLFPTEHQKEHNIVYKLIEEGEAIDENAAEIKYKITKTQQKYIWNGTDFSELIELK